MSFDHVLLCIRGTLADGSDRAAARTSHNATAGNPEGVAAAKALGDLSHKVFVSADEAGAMAGAKADELLILDVWQTPEAISKFFASPAVSQGGAKLFKARDPVVFMPAVGALSFTLPAPMAKRDRYVGILRGTVKSPELAISTFKREVGATLNPARQLGQLSHELYVKLAPPNADGSVEILGVDVWCDLEGMGKHYGAHMKGLMPAFVGQPTASIWKAPEGEWVEW
jgi:hypothetical protein